MTYKFKWRRRWFWKSITVMGHRWDEPQDKMLLYRPDGSLWEIKHWRKCEVRLGVDWVLFVKKDAEKGAGTSIPLNV